MTTPSIRTADPAVPAHIAGCGRTTRRKHPPETAEGSLPWFGDRAAHDNVAVMFLAGESQEDRT